jgi:septal ring factor EnvC (AmiA/AmiB activator)
MQRTSIHLLSIAAPLLLLVGVGSALAEEESFASRRAQLRAEVEERSAELQDQRADVRSQLRALRSQRVEMEAQLRREELRQAQAEERILESRVALDTASDDAQLASVVRDSAEELRAPITKGIPFRQEERMKALDELVSAMERNELSPSQALARLWGFAEDELRLGKEVGLHRQVIQRDGESLLVEVAHLGLVAVYYRTPDDEFGQAVRTNGGWSWKPVTDRDGRRQLDDLFLSLRRGVKEGWFELPGNPGGL